MKRIVSLVTLWVTVGSVCRAEAADLATVASDWHGYQKQSFSLAGHPAFVVVPKVAAPGKPTSPRN